VLRAQTAAANTALSTQAKVDESALRKQEHDRMPELLRLAAEVRARVRLSGTQWDVLRLDWEVSRLKFLRNLTDRGFGADRGHRRESDGAAPIAVAAKRLRSFAPHTQHVEEPAMNHSILTCGRTTHLKIVAVALITAVLCATVGLKARLDESA
jgi:hypothetical protein